ncbi:hypothetical protein VW35_10940 [Devosia soli]|uniref:Cation/H+ exchanger domain-containing protein n=1 Tax=Devosia soli TaxID=361041 RepID=A0A0F5L991_9HYPH|nr:hypothetical protein VW35_10940 [Devosia soli]
METFDWTIMLLFGAALLSSLAGRLSLRYPSLLALGGAAIAFLPFHPEWTLDPRLALTLFVAPVNDEVVWARSEAYGIGLQEIAGVRTPEADAVRQHHAARTDPGPGGQWRRGRGSGRVAQKSARSQT